MPKPKVTNKIKEAVRKRAKYCCEYCKLLQAFSSATFACEHILPTILDGTNDIHNLANACHTCNWSKAKAINAIDPITKMENPLFNPRKDIWLEHFKWSDNLLTIIGLTPTGRATISRLKMNRTGLQNIRSVTIGKGHPPD